MGAAGSDLYNIIALNVDPPQSYVPHLLSSLSAEHIREANGEPPVDSRVGVARVTKDDSATRADRRTARVGPAHSLKHPALPQPAPAAAGRARGRRASVQHELAARLGVEPTESVSTIFARMAAAPFNSEEQELGCGDLASLAKYEVMCAEMGALGAVAHVCALAQGPVWQADELVIKRVTECLRGMARNLDNAYTIAGAGVAALYADVLLPRYSTDLVFVRLTRHLLEQLRASTERLGWVRVEYSVATGRAGPALLALAEFPDHEDVVMAALQAVVDIAAVETGMQRHRLAFDPFVIALARLLVQYVARPDIVRRVCLVWIGVGCNGES
jgi:hypothetical protein